MIDIKHLTNLGLLPSEALIYKSLVEVGPCFVAPLVKKTKKHRQIVYNALEGIEKKNLIHVSLRNGKNFYTVSDPGKLLADIRQKEFQAKQIVQEIEKSLKKEKEQVDVFSGLNSYRDGLADFRLKASEAGEYVVIGGEPKEWYEFTKPFFAEHIKEVKKIKQSGVNTCILFYDKERSSAEEYILPHVNKPYVCKIASEQYRLPNTVWLAGEYVYILTPTADPLVVRIKSNPLAQQYRSYFSSIWKDAVLLK